MRKRIFGLCMVGMLLSGAAYSQTNFAPVKTGVTFGYDSAGRISSASLASTTGEQINLEFKYLSPKGSPTYRLPDLVRRAGVNAWVSMVPDQTDTTTMAKRLQPLKATPPHTLDGCNDPPPDDEFSVNSGGVSTKSKGVATKACGGGGGDDDGGGDYGGGDYGDPGDGGYAPPSDPPPNWECLQNQADWNQMCADNSIAEGAVCAVTAYFNPAAGAACAVAVAVHYGQCRSQAPNC